MIENMAATSARFSYHANNNNTMILPSMTISNDSETPYTDATQVRKSTPGLSL